MGGACAASTVLHCNPYRLNPDPLYVDRDGSLEQRDVDYDLVSVF